MKRNWRRVMKIRVLIFAGLFCLLFNVRHIWGAALGNVGELLLLQSLAVWPQTTEEDKLRLAEGLLTRASSVNPEHVSFQQALGYIKLLNGDSIEAVSIWRHIPDSDALLLSRGIVAYQSNTYEEAIFWLNLATQVKPDLGKAWYYLGLSYSKLEQPEKAWEALQMAEEQADSQSIISSIYYSQGNLLADTPSSLPDALQLYSMALDADRFIEAWRRRDAYYSQGEVLSKLGRYDEAVQSYRAVLALYTDHYWARVRLGRAIWLASGNLEEAEKYFLEAIELNTPEKSAYRWLALTYQEAGRIQEATVTYRKVLEIDPEDKMALEFLGEVP